MALKKLHTFDGDALPPGQDTPLVWHPPSPVCVRGLIWRGGVSNDLFLSEVKVGMESLKLGDAIPMEICQQHADGSPVVPFDAGEVSSLSLFVRIHNEGQQASVAHLEVWGED